MQGIATGGRTFVGPDQMYPWRANGTVSAGSVYGPAAGQAASTYASQTPIMTGRKTAGSNGLLSIPVIIALAALVWYATKNY